MKTALSSLLIFVLASITSNSNALAQPATETKTAVDPAATAALHSMGEFLRTLKVFQVQATTLTEDVLDDGQKIQYAANIDVLARRPDRMRAKIISDHQDRRFYYDGKTFTMFAPRTDFYTTVPAPATIGELVKHLTEKYNIEAPLADLFYWGDSDSNDAVITSATVVGTSIVEGSSCTHYAFRQSDIDWQIWIQNGVNALPRKLVITTTTDDARPQYSAVYTWNLAPAYNDDAFSFTPPVGTIPIPLIEVKPSDIIIPEPPP